MRYLNLPHFCYIMSESPRVTLVIALMNGQSLSASFLAKLVNMSPQATRFHLRKLEEAHIVRTRNCGRHHYYEMATQHAATFVEEVFGIIPPPKNMWPIDTPFIEARVCYNHFAGRWATDIANVFIKKNLIIPVDGIFHITYMGHDVFCKMGLELPEKNNNSFLAKRCIDVTEHRDHIGGHLGAILLNWMIKKEWLQKQDGSRIMTITKIGKKGLQQLTLESPLTDNIAEPERS